VNRRRLVVVSMFAAPFVAVGVACTFPDVSFGPAAAAGDEDAAQEAGSEGDADGGTDAADLADVFDFGDVATRGDANQVVDANACATKPVCDCDEDGYLDIHCDAGPDAAGPGKQPGDCDDLDPLRYPGALPTDAVPVGHEGDWNCDGVVTRTPAAEIKCSGTGLTGCTGGPGFLNKPACGTKADAYSCEASGIFACQAVPKGTVTQLCQ